MAGGKNNYSRRKTPPHGAPLTVTRKDLLKQGSDVQFRAMLNNLIAFSGRLESIRKYAGLSIGLSEVQYSIIMSVLHLQGNEGIGVKKVAEHLWLSGPFVTSEVGKLIKLDLISKRVNPEDRRRVLLTITSKGHELLSSLNPLQTAVNDCLFSTLSDKDFDTLTQLSEELVTSADEAAALAQYMTRSSVNSAKSQVQKAPLKRNED